MDAQPRSTPAAVTLGQRQFDRVLTVVTKPVQPGGGPMRENGVWAAGEHARPLGRSGRPGRRRHQRVDPAVHRVQTTARKRVTHRPWRDTEREQLVVADHRRLPTGQLTDRAIRPCAPLAQIDPHVD